MLAIDRGDIRGYRKGASLFVRREDLERWRAAAPGEASVRARSARADRWLAVGTLALLAAALLLAAAAAAW